MRSIGVVTVARSDYGIYLPILRRIRECSDLRLLLYVGGMHLSPEFGLTVEEIEKDGFEIADRIEMLLSSDTPEGMALTAGLGTIGFARAYARTCPEILLVLGDRIEMHAAAVASLPFKVPLAHIHGGELSEGAIDDALRHSITKLSHLHFVSTTVYGNRVIQMGEESWRVVVSGAPSLDNLKTVPALSAEEIEDRYGVKVGNPFLLVTYHPVTLEQEHSEYQIRELLAALDTLDMVLVFTYPNSDVRGRLIIRIIEEFAASRPNVRVFPSLGTRGYFSMMAEATAMVGNSSSGIIEAASLQLPVVNVGNRQRGRVRGKNVIDVGNSREEVLAGVQLASNEEFRKNLAGLVNPYGDGKAAERIVETLSSVELNSRLTMKQFRDA